MLPNKVTLVQTPYGTFIPESESRKISRYAMQLMAEEAEHTVEDKGDGVYIHHYIFKPKYVGPRGDNDILRHNGPYRIQSTCPDLGTATRRMLGW